tara:strand:- start:26730 stop:27623 length:894 start_codon:yes stop_codon:yes gene_type:complete
MKKYKKKYMVSVMYYTLSDFDNISFESYELSASVIESINILDSILNVNVEKKEHSYEKKQRSWNHTKTFQKTTFIQNVSEEDKIYNEIRNGLNKMSLANYDTQSQNLKEAVEKCENKEKIVHIIYNVACSNKVFSELYAKLYKELCDSYECFASSIDTMIDSYKMSAVGIIYKDPNVDYDEYCLYTKKNDKMRASLLFYINLFKYGLLKQDDIISLILFLLNTIDENKVIVERRNEIEEYVEQLFVLCKNMNLCLFNNFEEIKTRIEIFSHLKNGGEIVSMSSRVNFRCMDILDNVN